MTLLKDQFNCTGVLTNNGKLSGVFSNLVAPQKIQLWHIQVGIPTWICQTLFPIRISLFSILCRLLPPSSFTWIIGCLGRIFAPDPSSTSFKTFSNFFCGFKLLRYWLISWKQYWSSSGPNALPTRLKWFCFELIKRRNLILDSGSLFQND